MENVVFTYQRTKEDIIKQNVWQSFFRKKVVLFATFMFPVIGIYFLITNIISGADPLILLAVTYLILYPLINYLFIIIRVNRLFKNPDLKLDTTTFDYGQDGITVSSVEYADEGEILLEYGRIAKVYNTKGYIYIFVDNRSSIMVNKSILRPDEVEFILKVLKENTISTACNY